MMKTTIDHILLEMEVLFVLHRCIHIELMSGLFLKRSTESFLDNKIV